MSTLGKRWAKPEHFRKQRQNEYLQKQLSNTRVLRIDIELKDRFEHFRDIFSTRLGHKYTINEMMNTLLESFDKES